jgi:hypothetical protein
MPDNSNIFMRPSNLCNCLVVVDFCDFVGAIFMRPSNLCNCLVVVDFCDFVGATAGRPHFNGTLKYNYVFLLFGHDDVFNVGSVATTVHIRIIAINLYSSTTGRSNPVSTTGLDFHELQPPYLIYITVHYSRV